MSKNDGGSAFANMTAKSCGPVEPRCEGMSLRDWFAGQALAGLLAHEARVPSKLVSGAAYAMADAMIAERAK